MPHHYDDGCTLVYDEDTTLISSFLGNPHPMLEGTMVECVPFSLRKRGMCWLNLLYKHIGITSLGKVYKIGIPHYHDMALHQCMMEHHTKIFLLCRSRFESVKRLGQSKSDCFSSMVYQVMFSI